MKFDIQVDYDLVGGSGCQWPVPKCLQNLSTCLSGGVGRDLGFESYLANELNMKVYAFDPTPRSIEWISTQELSQNIEFRPYGLYGSTCDLVVSPPKVQTHVSFGLCDNPDSSSDTLSVPCLSPEDATHACKCRSFDIIKIDIEGSEYSFIESLKSSIEAEIITTPLVILCEFHHGMYGKNPIDTQAAHQQLKELGFHRFYKSRDGRDQGFIHSSALKLNRLGIMYVAFGEKYVREAAISAESAKACSDIETFIVTDKSDICDSKCFDYFYIPSRLEAKEVERVIASENRWPSIKIMFLQKTIFTETIFLDSDTYIARPLTSVSALLKEKDLLLTNMPKVNIDYSDANADRPKHSAIAALTSAGFSCAVFAFRMSLRMSQFLEYWKIRFIEESMNAQHKGKGNWGHTGGINEQSVLHSILSEGYIQKSNMSRGTLDNRIYNCGLSMWSSLHKQKRWSDVSIIHSHAISSCISLKLPLSEWPLSSAAQKFQPID